MWPRIPQTVWATSVEEAVAVAIGLHGRPLVDLDGTLVPQSAGLDDVSATAPPEGVIRSIRELGAVIVTNRRAVPERYLGLPVIGRARKPFTDARLLPDAATIACVIGDQLMTDGLLAGRLGVPFIQVAPRGRRPWRAAIGDRVLRCLFRRKPDRD